MEQSESDKFQAIFSLMMDNYVKNNQVSNKTPISTPTNTTTLNTDVFRVNTACLNNPETQMTIYAAKTDPKTNIVKPECVYVKLAYLDGQYSQRIVTYSYSGPRPFAGDVDNTKLIYRGGIILDCPELRALINWNNPSKIESK